jgi:hypothetical protein
VEVCLSEPEKKAWIKRLAKISGWVVLTVGLPWGLWWLWHTPTTGKGGLLLAFVATVMPLVWDDVHAFGRAGLILTLAVLFAVEYRAIDKEHKDYADEQARARRDEKDDFQRLLDAENQDVGNLLEQEKKNVKGVLEQEQGHFDKMLASTMRAQRQESTDFASMLNQQHVLFERQRETIESLNGHLLPADDPMPTLADFDCEGMSVDINKDTFIVTGTVTNVPDAFPFPVLNYNGRDLISVSQSPEGLLVLSIDIHEKSGRILVKLDDSGLDVNPLLFKKHPDKSTLIIEDSFGNEVLRARYANKRYLYVRGKIILDGEVVDIPMGTRITGGCLAGRNSIKVVR